MKKILITLAAVFALVSCDMDFFSSDTISSAMLKENPGAAVYTTDGVYSMFKDVLKYQGSEYSANTYVRHLLLMSELRGDNVFVTFASEDKFFDVYTYIEDPTCQNLGYFWWCAYRIIYGANSNIEAIPEGASVETDHLLGENYFIRAITHLHLSTLYSRPYLRGRDNLGVVLRTSTDCSVTERATVGKVYDQIVDDLKDAMRLMKNGSRRGHAGYASYEAAAGLLTRVYLYRGENDLCVQLADEILGSDPSAHLEQGYERLYNYFSDACNSKETLWCVAKYKNEVTDENAGSQVGSMYYVPVVKYTDGGTPVNAKGWGEFSWSDKLMNVFDRYPEDLRYRSYLYKYGNDAPGVAPGQKLIYFSKETISIHEKTGKELITQMPVKGTDVVYNEVDGTYTFKYVGKTFTVKSKMINKDKVWYVEEAPHASCPRDEDGHCRVSVRDYVLDNAKFYPGYMMRKFAEQDGITQLSSPVMIRWAEVILNRAEANCKLGNEGLALQDVNVLRRRAALPEEAMFTPTNYTDWGYKNVLEVVLEERNMELCFEGHRAIDLYRNNLPIDRRYPGLQDYKVLDLAYLDANFPLCIPFNEVEVSGIQQNK